MARIRSVHPGLFSDEDFVGLSDAAQVFFIGLWTEADDFGAFEWKPVTLKIKLRGASTMPVDPLLEELRAADRVRRYEHDGRQYGVIRNFTKFQRPKFPKSAHFIPPELRKFAGSTEPITEIGPVDEPPIPIMGENPPQMEDEGGRMKDEGYSDANASGGEPPPVDPVKQIFDRGLVILGGDTPAHRKLLGKLRQAYQDVVVLASIVECENEIPSEPAAFLVACCERRKSNGRLGSAASAIDKLGAWARQEDEPEGFRGHH